MDYDELMASRGEAVNANGKSATRRVIGWISNTTIETRGLVDVGGWGGVFSEGDRWNDYIANIDDTFVAHHGALRRRRRNDLSS